MTANAQPEAEGGQGRGHGRLIAWLWVGSAAVCIALTGANLLLGDLNQDEGWYLYAARLVSEGRLPYRDFAFTQGPAMACVYAGAQPLVDAFGVAGGRLFTAVLGLLAALLAAILAGRLVSPDRRRAAALLAFMLAALNVYQSYFCSIVKTYSLCALFMMLGFMALSLARRRSGGWWAALAGACMTLAAATRISAGILLPVVFLFLLVRRGMLFNRPGSAAAWFWFGAGAVLAGCAVFLPFFLAAPDNFIFWMLKYHSSRSVGGFLQLMVYKAGFISRVVQGYFVAIGLLCASVLFRILRAGRAGDKPAPSAVAASDGTAPLASFAVLLWLCVAAVTAVHFMAPFPYDDYQAAVFPLFAAGLACLLAGLPAGPRAVSWLLAVVFLLSTASAFSSPINQSWFIRERDRIWWRLKEKTPLALLHEAGVRLRAIAGPDGRVLTQDTYLAVEAGLRVPDGMEMGPFSYYPGWDKATAVRRHVLNGRLLRDLITGAGPSVAAFSGYGLSIGSPGVVELPAEEQAELRRLVLTRYKVVEEVRHFGQDMTTLVILRKTVGAGLPASREGAEGAASGPAGN